MKHWFWCFRRLSWQQEITCSSPIQEKTTPEMKVLLHSWQYTQLYHPHTHTHSTVVLDWLCLHYLSVTFHCVFRSHRSHHRAVGADSFALRFVWQVLQRVLQQERWDSLPSVILNCRERRGKLELLLQMVKLGSFSVLLIQWTRLFLKPDASLFLSQVTCVTSPTWSRGVCSRFCWRSTSGHWTRRLSSVTSCWPCWSCSLSVGRRRRSACSTRGCRHRCARSLRGCTQRQSAVGEGWKRLLSSHNVGNCYLDHVSALIPEVTGWLIGWGWIQTESQSSRLICEYFNMFSIISDRKLQFFQVSLFFYIELKPASPADLLWDFLCLNKSQVDLSPNRWCSSKHSLFLKTSLTNMQSLLMCPLKRNKLYSSSFDLPVLIKFDCAEVSFLPSPRSNVSDQGRPAPNFYQPLADVFISLCTPHKSLHFCRLCLRILA